MNFGTLKSCGKERLLLRVARLQSEVGTKDVFGVTELLTKKSAFLKHAFREVTCGFCKGTVPGAPPLPSPGPLRMPKNNSKETYLVPPEGHISVKNM